MTTIISNLFNGIKQYFAIHKNSRITTHLSSNPLFAGLTPQELEKVMQMAELIRLEPEHILFTQDEPADHLYIIEEGEVALIREEAGTLYEHNIHMNSGQVVGESALIPTKSYEFSAAVKTPTRIWRIPSKALQKENSQQSAIVTRISYNLSKLLSAQLHSNHTQTIKFLQEKLSLKKMQLTLTHFMIQVFITLSVYIISYAFVMRHAQTVASISIASSLCILFNTGLTIYFIKKTQLPLSTYGLTFNNWQFAIKDSLLFTLPIVALIILSYSAFTTFNLSGNLQFLLAFKDIAAPTNHLTNLWVYTSYLLLVPFQELTARGCLQNTFEYLLEGRHKLLKAILVSNLVFAAFHAHAGIALAAVVFVFGVFWGWLYTRHRTLVGVCLSHTLIGMTAIYFNIF